VAGVILLIGLTRYVEPLCCITPSTPPGILPVALALVLVAGLGAAVCRLAPGLRWPVIGLTVLLIAVLVVLKTEPLALVASSLLRRLAGQSAVRAAALDLRWVGFSYVAFRLMHVLLDRFYGRLPAFSLREFITYTLFFPAFTAGPIDRVERFIKDMRAPFMLGAADLAAGGQRIVLGLLKKFILADGLAFVALNAQNASQVSSTGWTWFLLYAYAFRLFLDFAGYTDIAIGIGLLAGIRLPENFDRPYLKPNLTTFWNSWHMTLAQWFRAYWFNPTTRAMRTRSLPVWLIIALGQLTTMVFIGLWHGFTWNFVLWGAWHGLGLFIHNRWMAAMRTRMRHIQDRPGLSRAVTAASVALTFHYVVVGWVWFALPEFTLAKDVFLRLFGIANA
jgi:D-alanyl-lipoteichoic acid acyltransferase DltB (MBOAT superfamily)